MLDNFPSFSTLSGGGNSVLTGNVGANSGISLGGGGSHSSGNNYGLVGGSALHHSGLGGDSISSSAAAASMGLPASPMSFSGISGGPPPTTSAPPPAPLISTSLLRQGATTLNRLEKQESMQHHHQMQQPQGSSNSSQISQQQSQAQLSQQQEQQQSNHQSQQNVHQEQLQSHALGNTQHQGPQVMGMNHQATTFGAGQQMMMLGQQQQQLQGHQLELQQVEQPMQHLLHHHHHQQQQQQQQHLVIPKTEDDLPHQIIQQSLQRSNSLLSPHMQRQDVMHLQRQHSQQIQAHMNLLQHQRILQHQQQQQQLLQSLPQHLRQQQQQQHQQQQQQLQQQLQLQQQHASMQLGIPKQPHLEPGACSRRLMQYIYQQRHRPADNNILFWRKFVAEYFAPRAKKRWCVSLYGSGGRQPTGVFPQDVWQCEICGTKPGRGFETTVEVLPRLCKIKYDSGIQEELLFVDLPHEYRLASGLMVLEYQKATQESIFEQLRVVREGQLRIIFSSDLKIVSWEFCARSHEEFLPRKMIVSEVTQLATVAQKYQTSVTQSGSNGLSSQDLESIYNMFVSSSRHVARNLEAPTVNDLGYTKRYVRCLQISEVVNSMKDLIDFSHETNQGPIESLMSFPRRSASSNQNQSVHQQQQQQHQHQQEQLSLQALVQDENIPTMNSGQHVMNRHIGNGGVSMNGTSNATLLGSFPSIVQQNSLSMLQTPKSLVSSVQNPGSMQNVLHSHPNALSSFQMNSSIQSPTVNNLEGNAGSLLQQVSLQSGQGTQHDTQNVVHHFLQEVMNAQLSNGGQFQQGLSTPSSGGGNMGNVLNGVNTTGSLHTSGNNANMANCLGSSNSNLGGLVNNSVAGLPSLGNGLRNIGGNHHLSSMASMNSLNGRLSMAAVSAAAQQQNIQLQDSSTSLHDVAGNGILNGVGAGAGYNNLQFNWKSS